MKNIRLKNTLAIAALVIAVAGAGVFGITKANAATDTTNPVSSLVQKIATKFNVSQSDVQAVFDQDRTDREAQHEAEYEKQLSQYVTDGKITQAQKELILAKHKEMKVNRQTEMENMKNMTEEQRRAAMDQKRTELKAWAKQNNIDLQYVMPFGRHGHHGMRGEGMPNTTAPTSTSSPTTTQ